jgi:hypothetical protein
VIRVILVPAAVILLGDRRRYWPRWLRGIPDRPAEPARGGEEQPVALTGAALRLS